MATKTFKIGLSNTDKQNMAQEVYERLLALTFPEYDTDTSYDVGDFVVYNDQLYKCIGATSGAWDSSKWQLATLNDLLTDIEDAVQFVNDKANVDGNYPTMTVGVADQLSPYDDESGDDQEEPFSFQATGTGNGTQPDFSTGSIALMKEKQGNSVVVNQGAKVLNATNWISSSATASYDNGVATFTASDTNGNIRQLSVPFIVGHKYLIQAEIKTTTATTDIYLDIRADNVYGKNCIATTNWQLVTNLVTVTTVEGVADYIRVRDARTSDWDAVQVKNIILIDLTQWFGSNDNIPANLLAHPENFFRYYQGSLAYNTGELVNANSRYLKAIGRNQWDEDLIKGDYIDGELDTNYPNSCSKIFRVIPNREYYFYRGSLSVANYGYYLTEFDAQSNFIKKSILYTSTFTTSPNTCFIAFTNEYNYGLDYNHDITISLYYEGESGYDQYYPYELLTNNDTGAETLRSAGSVHDIKKPDGSIVRNVGYVDLGTLTWEAGIGVNQDIKRYYTGNIASLIKHISASQVMNSNCIKFIGASVDYGYNGLVKECITVNDVGTISIYTDVVYADATAFKTAMSGVYLFYELVTPTTEQGTPYSENIVIDDFGSMDFSGTSGVPQGNLIFYPVDYKAFIDTLYDYTEGTPSNIALKSDLSADKSELQGVDTQLLNAVGGTLRHCLAIQESDLDFEDTDFVDLGSLNWAVDTGRFFASISNMTTGTTRAIKMICSKYVAITDGRAYDQVPDKSCYGTATHEIYVVDSSYSDATVFKAAMKGVLLAYEKASE